MAGSDHFQLYPRELEFADEDHIRSIKIDANGLWLSIQHAVPEGRERSLALTKIEEAVMWAIKGISK